MANIFLDANILLDIFDRKVLNEEFFGGNNIFISPLSIHLLCHFAKVVAPDPELLDQIDQFNIVDLTAEIATRSFLGPTKDYEDNVQLHSSVACGASIFYTSDKNLLKLGFFGFTRILPTGDTGNLSRFQ